MSKRIKINIDGLSFYVIGSEDEKYIRALADKLNKRIDYFQKNNYRLSQNGAYILSALNSLDECEKLKKEQRDVKDLSKDEIALKEKLENIRKLEEKLSKVQANLKKKTEEYEELASSLKSKDKEIKDLKSEKIKDQGKINQSEEELLELRELNKQLKEKNFNSQKSIIQLSRQLESLYENRNRQ